MCVQRSVGAARSESRRLGLYLHVPFCLRKCGYCDFVSFAGRSGAEMSAYVDALVREMACSEAQYRNFCVDSIFIGGGTPTALPQRMLARVIEAVRTHFRVLPECEFTVECNPGTADGDYFRLLHALGVNRLSVGAQSFSDRELAVLGRIHTAGDIVGAVESARTAGFDNISLDLMTGFFGQTRSSLASSLREAVALAPAHLSVYSLIMEEGTPFARMAPELLPDEETERAMYDDTVEFLAHSGFARYEISNFARPGRECRHNLKYWTLQDYRGFGLAAHSCVGNVRFCNTSDFAAYCRGDGVEQEREAISPSDQMGEYMMLGLRLTRGVSKAAFRERFGVALREQYGEVVERHLQNGLLLEEGDALFLSERGVSLSNYVMCDFL